MHIGILGFGKMGRSIAERLIEKGNQITAWIEPPAKLRRLIMSHLSPVRRHLSAVVR